MTYLFVIGPSSMSAAPGRLYVMVLPTQLPVVSLHSGASEAPCGQCHAGCCRAFAVPLTGADIFRIAHGEGLGFGNFVCRWVDRNGDISRGLVPQFYFEDAPETPFVICLKQIESRLFPGTRRCQFLHEETSGVSSCDCVGNCTIYHSRPAACRVFPFRYSDDGQVTTQVLPEQSGSTEFDPYALCPRRWSLTDELRIQAEVDLRDCLMQLEIFRLVASQWNTPPGPWPLFPEYLREIYSQLLAAA